MPGDTHLKLKYHVEEILGVDQQAKNQPHPSSFLWDILYLQTADGNFLLLFQIVLIPSINF